MSPQAIATVSILLVAGLYWCLFRVLMALRRVGPLGAPLRAPPLLLEGPSDVSQLPGPATPRMSLDV
jgi:hypothetical protein